MNTEPGICYKCGRWGYTEQHHCLHGTANRRIADREGLWVYLCKECHTEGKKAVHKCKLEDLKLEREAQEVWEERYKRLVCSDDEMARTEFRKLFGKSYL